MARRRSVPLTEVEQRLMEIVWAAGPVTVAQVVEALPEDTRPAYNTVQTMMKILERKGYVHHRAEGRAFVYHSVVDRASAAHTALSQVVQRFFGGSPRALALNLIQGDQLSEDELDELLRTIERAKDEG
jgi:predicted transcriptional regulator